MKKLVLFSNYLNHHQQPLADAFYELLGDSFAFVATMPVDDLELKGGKDYSSREYCVVAAKDCTSKALAMNLARTSEICIFGAQSLDYAIERAKQPNCGLSFEFGERWLKRGWINVLSPHLRRWWLNYQRYFRHKPFYKLNASAFAAADHWKLHTYEGRCYRWGYFTAVPEKNEVETSRTPRADGRKIAAERPPLCDRLLWKRRGGGFHTGLGKPPRPRGLHPLPRCRTQRAGAAGHEPARHLPLHLRQQ